jgi:uncharacterized protein (DUF2252 family)
MADVITTAPTLSAPPSLTPAERAELGKAARREVPRASHAEWDPAPDRDPIGLLESQAVTRVPELVPLRHGRMAASEFAFYRGAALVMAADLARTTPTTLRVQLCGDAHLVNFGGFASPEREMVFDLNDFDETLPGPFEWDVKRLAASLEVACRSRNLTEAETSSIILAAIKSYREAIRRFGTMRRIDVWYTHLDANAIVERWGSAVGGRVLDRFRKTVQKAESKDHLKAKAKLTEVVDGELRFRSDPPLLVPAEDTIPADEHARLFEVVRRSLQSYRRTLNGDRRHLLDQYRFVHLARKVVGVGSVGTRCWLALLVGRDLDDPLFIQVKEAEASVLERYLGGSQYGNHGQRVVEGQRLMQASSDIMLGWERTTGVDDREHDYYFRQLWDWKASADVATMEPPGMLLYGELCGWTLARGHARSGDPIAIGAYLGSSTSFDRALREFARTYADQNTLDHQALVDAIASGRVKAEEG